MWSLTSSYHGQRRVERVPDEWRAELEQAMLATQSYMDAVKEVMAINVELLAQSRRQQQARKVRPAAKKRQKARQPAKK